jgi:hypothetical protein
VIDAVRAALTALRARGRPALGDLSVIDFEGIDGTLLAVDDKGRPHLLITLQDGAAEDVPASDVATLQIGVRTLVIAGQTQKLLDVACLFESLAEVFDHFIVAVLERLGGQPRSPERAIAEVLANWRQFLVAASGPPGRDKLAAVFGELLVLLDVVRAGSIKSIDAWVGPFGGRHDIRRATYAIEVKTTLSHTSRNVTIHGEDQLEAPDGGTLHLHLVRLEQVSGGGRSVTSLVDELLSLGVRAEELFQAVSAAGIPLPDLSATADVGFEIRERLTIPVDDGMPRIVPTSFVSGARPVGVIELTYTIDLDHSLDRALDVSSYGALVKQLGTLA